MMTGETGMVTVYRSTDMSASQDAETVRNMLLSNGIDAQVADDNAPGVPAGAFEVRVPPDQATRAEELIAAANATDEMTADPSRDLDMVTLRETAGATGEIEALGIKGILDANGINCFVVGSSTMPNLSFFVTVAKADYDRAVATLEEAEAAGPAAAVEAERESEGNPPL
jgi:hypothetical protein